MFHESIHQWDEAVAMLLDAQARPAGAQLEICRMPLSFTAGEAVRRVAPAGYVSLRGFRWCVAAWDDELEGRAAGGVAAVIEWTRHADESAGGARPEHGRDAMMPRSAKAARFWRNT